MTVQPVLREVIGDQAEPPDPDPGKDLGADAVAAGVDGQALGEVGVDGVEILFWQGIGANLVGNADTAASCTRR